MQKKQRFYAELCIHTTLNVTNRQADLDRFRCFSGKTRVISLLRQGVMPPVRPARPSSAAGGAAFPARSRPSRRMKSCGGRCRAPADRPDDVQMVIGVRHRPGGVVRVPPHQPAASRSSEGTAGSAFGHAQPLHDRFTGSQPAPRLSHQKLGPIPDGPRCGGSAGSHAPSRPGSAPCG